MIDIRPAEQAEIDALTAICHRSKAHWGYDRDFMEKCRDALTVQPERVEAGEKAPLCRIRPDPARARQTVAPVVLSSLSSEFAAWTKR